MPLIGMDALLRQMADAPDAMRREGMEIVRETTEACAAEIANQYGEKTGRLKRGVRTVYPSTTVLVGIVESKAPHSHIYENGTQQRRTSRGHNRGRMPSTPRTRVTPNVAPKHRDRMHRKLVAMVEKHGFEVIEE